VDLVSAFQLTGDSTDLQVVAITAQNDPNASVAELTPDTSFTFEPGQPFLKIKGQNSVQRLFKHDFDISQLGIGGLDAQFNEIFRGAFASRAAPPAVAKLMNIQHTKGILLYGPPGTGALPRCATRLCTCRQHCLQHASPAVVFAHAMEVQHLGHLNYYACLPSE
jgi:hypothetical protein